MSAPTPEWTHMTEPTLDRAAMGKLAKAIAFICGPNDAAAVALRKASETGAERDIKQARALFLKLKPGDRRAALAMIGD